MAEIKHRAQARKFLDWQSEYARKQIATFPVLITAEGKKPLVRHFQHIGPSASADIAANSPTRRASPSWPDHAMASQSSMATSRCSKPSTAMAKRRSSSAQHPASTMAGSATTVSGARCGQNPATRSISSAAAWSSPRHHADQTALISSYPEILIVSIGCPSCATCRPEQGRSRQCSTHSCGQPHLAGMMTCSVIACAQHGNAPASTSCSITYINTMPSYLTRYRRPRS